MISVRWIVLSPHQYHRSGRTARHRRPDGGLYRPHASGLMASPGTGTPKAKRIRSESTITLLPYQRFGGSAEKHCDKTPWGAAHESAADSEAITRSLPLNVGWAALENLLNAR